MHLLKKNGKFRKGAVVRLTNDAMASVGMLREGDEVRFALGYNAETQVSEGGDHSQVFRASDLREFASELVRVADALAAIRSKG